MKYLDLRVLKIETSGESNPKGSDMKLIGIIDAVSFKEQVLNQREIIQSNQKSNSLSISESEKTNILLEEIRNLLKNINND